MPGQWTEVGGGGSATAGAVGGAAQVGSGGSGAAELGSWDAPFVVSSLPFETDGDTTRAVAIADTYAPCAPDVDESGGEVVYRIDVMGSGFLYAWIDEPIGDVDVDVHLLADPDPNTCITRGHMDVGSPVVPGSYWLTVDTWVDDDAVAHAGAYTIHVELVEDDADCLTSPIVCTGEIAPFVNMATSEETGDAGCLEGMARIDDYCIDRYEAMLVEVLPDDTLAPLSPFANPGDTIAMALSVGGATPQGFITQLQADAACTVAGKRLCNNEEWLRACQGEANSQYPYGDPWQPGACNEARECHPVVQYFESSEEWVWSELAHPCISQLPDGLATAGEYAACVSGEGVYDLVGNLHEWTADPAGTFRGGFYVDTMINGVGCGYATTAHNVQHWDYSTGFRCCRDAD